MKITKQLNKIKPDMHMENEKHLPFNIHTENIINLMQTHKMTSKTVTAVKGVTNKISNNQMVITQKMTRSWTLQMSIKHQ